MTQETYNTVTLIVNILSAVGTISASCIALWIALYHKKIQLNEDIKIKVSLCNLMQTSGTPIFINIKNLRDEQRQNSPEKIFIQISIYNIGIKDIYIQAVGFSSKKCNSGIYLSENLFVENYNLVQVKSGNSHSLYINLQSILQDKYIPKYYHELNKKETMRIYVITTMEGIFAADIPLELHSYLQQAVKVHFGDL